MKKIIASVGAVALGILSMQSAFAQAQLESEKSLPWLSASLAVRGFYDDNIMSSPESFLQVVRDAAGNVVRDAAGNVVTRRIDPRKDSFGFQIAPAIGLKYQDETTIASVRYEYGYTYYGDRDPKADQSHLVDALFSHQFSDSVSLKVTDSFAMAQEPETLSDFGGEQFFTRAEGNNIRNFAEILLGVKYYENLGLEVGYRNSLWNFEDDNYSFYLNRIEHTPHLDLYYDLDEVNRFFVGYQFNYADYNDSGEAQLYSREGQFLRNFDGTLATYDSDLYDRKSHSGYLGYRLTLAQGIDWTTRVGVQYTSWENADDYTGSNRYANGSVDIDKDNVNPFVESVFAWNYMENCRAQLGIRHEVGASQWGAMDAEATTVYASVSHEIMPKLTAALNGVYQHSSYGSTPGSASGAGIKDDYFSVGPCVSYRLTNLDCPVGTYIDLSYSYDYLDSTLTGRGYDRNRFILGVRATY